MIYKIKYVLFFVIFSCTSEVVKEKEKIDLNINFNSSSTIIFHYQNAQDSTFLTTSFYNFFPSDYIENKTLLPNKEGKKFITLKIQHPKKIDLIYGNFMASCFLIPDDTLKIYINLDTTQNIKKSIRFVGKYASINNFYKNKEIYFNKFSAELNLQKTLAFNAQNTLSEYTTIMDSLTKIELDFINNYKDKNTLPQWFINYELSEIKCYTAGSKLIIVPYRRDFLNQEISIPRNYYNKIDSLMIGYSPSIISSNYFIYLEDNFQDQLDKLPNSILRKNYHKILIDTVTKKLNTETADIYLAQCAERFINSDRSNDTNYQLYYNAIQNKKFKTYLSNMKKEKGEFLNFGEKAPTFMLPNINGKEVQLKDFKGNIVYISFWFAGCKPCQSEFPNENDLVEKFKGKKVKIINICTITSEGNWKKVSTKFNLQMINLYADKTLSHFLERKYGITSYPHHVLIDAEGKIIKNQCVGANSIEVEINEQLKRL